MTGTINHPTQKAKHRGIYALVDALAARERQARDQAEAELFHRWQADPSIESAVAEVLVSHDPDARRRGCELYAVAPTIADPSPLIRCLTDESGSVRTTAAHAVGRHRVATPFTLVALLSASADRDPAVRVTALAALAVIAPSPAVISTLGAALVTDRFGVASLALRTLEGAGTPTVMAAAPLLDSRDPFERRGALAVIHASGAPVDPMAPLVLRLTAAGTDTHVRRAAVRVLGRLAHPGFEVLALLDRLTNDWDPILRTIATVSLGQLATRTSSAQALYVSAVQRAHPDDTHDLAAALRVAGPPVPPSGPLLEQLATAAAFARLDLADAMVAPYRARVLVPGVTTAGVVLPTGDARLDDVLEGIPPDRRPQIAARFLDLTGHPEAVVRACAAVCASFLDRGIATAIVLQRLAEADDNPSVRTVGRALLQELQTTAR